MSWQIGLNFNFQIQAIAHKSVERQVIKSLKKIEIVWL